MVLAEVHVDIACVNNLHGLEQRPTTGGERMIRTAKLRMALGAIVAVFIGTAAQAQTTEVINLGNFTLAGGQSAVVAYNGDPANLTGVQGFKISFDYDDTADPFAYASDLRFTFNGWNWSVGGFTTASNADWTFDGPSDTGSFSHDTPTVWADAPFAKDALTSFTLANDYSFNGAVQWNNVTLTLYKVPAPGALALLGIAGIVGTRRRRV
jgi:hypothetical protein